MIWPIGSRARQLRAKIAAFDENEYYRDNKNSQGPIKLLTLSDEIAQELSITVHYLLGQLTVSEILL